MLRSAILICVLASSPLLAQEQPAAPRVQGGSSQQIDQSLRQIRATLSPEQTAKFDQAISAIITHFSLQLQKGIAAEMTGKSADELIALGDKYLQDPEVKAVSSQNMAQAKQAAMRSVQQTIRAQMELYKLQHSDAVPDFAKYQWRQFTEKTTEAGEPDPAGKFGPYLKEPPVNMYRGVSGVLVVEQKSSELQPVTDPQIGFVVTADRMFFALDEKGNPIP